MAIPHQKHIVVALWCLAVADAVRQGIALPHSELVAFTPAHREFNPAIAIFGLLGPSACLLGTVLLKSYSRIAEVAGSSWITRWVDRRWGAGSAAEFLRSLRPTALIGLGAFVLGFFGVASSIRADASPFSFEIASFFLAVGIGFGIARVLALRLLPNEPWF